MNFVYEQVHEFVFEEVGDLSLVLAAFTLALLQLNVDLSRIFRVVVA